MAEGWSPAARIHRAEGVVEERLGAETVLFHPTSLTLHLLDPAGTDVWSAVDGGTVADVVGETSARHPSAAGRIAREVPTFLADLAAAGLVTVDGHDSDLEKFPYDA